MKIAQLIFTRNEADILMQNIIFHKKFGVDFFFVTDAGSSDDSINILKKFEKDNLVRFFLNNKVMAQKESMEMMARVVAKEYNFDWIILSDTDEFWYAPRGLKAFFSNVNSNINTVKVKRFQYFPTELDKKGEKIIYKKLLYRETGKFLGIDSGVGDEENNFSRKKIAFRSMKGKIDIMTGNHTVHFYGRRFVEMNEKKIFIHEFPFRSYRQFRKKVIRTKTVIEKNHLFRDKKIATHWKTWLEISEKKKLYKYYLNNIFFDKKRLERSLKNSSIIKDTSLLNVD